jgi:hypothetical protein
VSIGNTRSVNQRTAVGLASVRFGAALFGAALIVAALPSLPAAGSEPAQARIEVFGDSVLSEAGQDFAFLAEHSGAAVQVHTFPGTSPCDYFSAMSTAARDWHPTVALLLFTGDVFTACNGSVQVGTPQYYAKYKDETRTAISIFRAVGARVVLIGQPADSSARLTRNGSALNALYREMARAGRGVTYDDAGQAVMAKGRFTWTLPCVPGQPCTGPHGTDVVRSPDGVHFCPSGTSTPDHGLELCDVYSSGAFRFASAMVKAALASRADPSRSGTLTPDG